MKVSIIIPCFRQGKYLAEAIESCLAQTYPDVEVIVVNDGSDDNTDEVVAKYQDKIRYIRKKNGGVTSARNAAIEIATGDYMKFLDADDHIVPTQIQWHMEGIAGRPNCVSVNSVRAYQDAHPERFIDYVHSLREMLPDLFNQPDSAPIAWLFPSQLVRAVNGFRDIPITQDWDFFCRIGKLRPQLHCDNRIGAYYRVYPGSMSSDKEAMTAEVAQQLIELHDEFQDGPNREWFGTELLGAEQRTYRRLLMRSRRMLDLEQQLLRRIGDLRAQVPRPQNSWKYELLSRLLGYRVSEYVYTRYLKRRMQSQRRSNTNQAD